MGGLLRVASSLVCVHALARTALAAPPEVPQPSEPVLGPYRRPPPAPPPTEPLVRSAARDYGRRQHDGFYLRLAGGIGPAFDALQASGANLSLSQAGGARGHAAGMAVATELAVGTSIWQGLVLGVGCDTALMPSPTASGAAGTDDYEFEATQLAVFDLLLDYYPVDRWGLHVQAGGGLGVVVLGGGTTPSGGNPAQPHTAVGPGLVVGAGHEWWVADQWSVGLLGRFMYGWAQGQDPLGATWSHEIGNLSLLVSATYQ
jgi:hypothetical protein